MTHFQHEKKCGTQKLSPREPMVVPAFAEATAGKLRGESFDKLRMKSGHRPFDKPPSRLRLAEAGRTGRIFFRIATRVMRIACGFIKAEEVILLGLFL